MAMTLLAPLNSALTYQGRVDMKAHALGDLTYALASGAEWWPKPKPDPDPDPEPVPHPRPAPPPPHPPPTGPNPNPDPDPEP